MSVMTQGRDVEGAGDFGGAPAVRPSKGNGATGDDGDGGPYGGLDEQRLARALAWFSIGLGLAEVLAPRAVQRLAGVEDDHSRLVRLMGIREIASGIGIFSQ